MKVHIPALFLAAVLTAQYVPYATATSQDHLHSYLRAIMLERASDEGIIRVIVILRIGDTNASNYRTFSQLSIAASEALRATILEVQQAFSARYPGLRNVKNIAGLPLTAADVPHDLLTILLNDTGMVERIVEDTLSAPALSDSVPLIGAEQAVANGIAGADQIIAVLDTGADLNHPMLENKIIEQACYSTTSQDSGGSETLCPGGVEEIVGENGAAAECDLSISGCGHGTHVTSIAAGDLYDNVVGVAHSANVIAINVFSKFTSNDTCARAGAGAPAPCALTFTSDQIAGLQWISELSSRYRISAVNMSISGGLYSEPCDASDLRRESVDKLLELDVATVVAAGNNAKQAAIGAPACISTAIAVGSTTKIDKFSNFSNSHDMIDLLAPGSDIRAAAANSTLVVMSGTSMAAPHVAAAFAMHRSKTASDPVAMILEALKENGAIISMRGIDKPRLDVEYLVN